MKRRYLPTKKEPRVDMDEHPLISYLIEKRLSVQEFSPLIGYACHTTLYAIFNGAYAPSEKVLHGIYKATDGAVTPNDVLLWFWSYREKKEGS